MTEAVSRALSWAPGPSREIAPPRRLFEVTLCVAVWIGIGALINDGGSDVASTKTINWYLLIGIPIVAIFQLYARRRPIKELWVRSGPRLVRLGLFRVLFVLIALYPIYSIGVAVVETPTGSFALAVYSLVSVAGAGAAAYAFTRFDRRTWLYLAGCLATAGVIGVGLEIAFNAESVAQSVAKHPEGDFWVFVLSLLTYIPSLYVMEEVAFRGCFDSHAHHQGDRRGLLTAIYVSVLWGAWHMPILGWENAAVLILYQGLVGTFLSIFWRRSGNLGVSATTHALIDSIRNGIGNTP